jgi:hypothetical protein
VCNGGGGDGVLDLRQINTCRKVPLQVNFFYGDIFTAFFEPHLSTLQRVLKPNGVLAVGAFDDMGVETPVDLSKEQQEHILAAQERFCQVHRLIIYTDTKASSCGGL